MATGWKIALGILAALAILVGLNALAVSGETGEAETTLPDGRILELNGGDLQIVDRGPRGAQPIVLIHCFTCAIDWWEPMMPRLEAEHRVVAVDLLGHGGSEKPASGYSIANQADLVAQALARLGVSDATVVGHSLGGTLSVALAESSPRLVDRIAILDEPSSFDEGELGLSARLTFAPVLGQALWRIKPDFSVRDGLEVAFATGKPVLVTMGAEEQIIKDPEAALAVYAQTVPGAETRLIQGAGHSPNVERPALTARLVRAFARQGMQERLQKRDGVRGRP